MNKASVHFSLFHLHFGAMKVPMCVILLGAADLGVTSFIVFSHLFVSGTGESWLATPPHGGTILLGSFVLEIDRKKTRGFDDLKIVFSENVIFNLKTINRSALNQITYFFYFNG